MKHEKKVEWMAVWAAKNNLKLELEGECGFGRECVGVTANECYPNYIWYNDDYERLDKNGDVWIPDDAYHKCEVVAVLGRGEAAESQLYDWLKWFDDNGFKLETGEVEQQEPFHPIELMLGKHLYQRFVKQ